MYTPVVNWHSPTMIPLVKLFTVIAAASVELLDKVDKKMAVEDIEVGTVAAIYTIVSSPGHF